LAAAPVQAEFRIFVREDLRLRGPKPMRYLQTMHCVGAAEFAGLNHESQQTRHETQ
jgi:hypothetical protein